MAPAASGRGPDLRNKLYKKAVNTPLKPQFEQSKTILNLSLFYDHSAMLSFNMNASQSNHLINSIHFFHLPLKHSNLNPFDYNNDISCYYIDKPFKLLIFNKII